MSIKFHVIEKSQPGIAGGGEKKFYASALSSGDMSLEGLTKAIEKSSTVSGADIRAVLYALVDIMSDNLSDGKIVRLGDLGSLRVSIGSEGKSSAEEVNQASITSSRVIFAPGKKLKEMLSILQYSKA